MCLLCGGFDLCFTCGASNVKVNNYEKNWHVFL